MEQAGSVFNNLLKGKTVLITGAARGVGRVTARIMAEEGMDVGVIDVLPEVEEADEVEIGLGLPRICA